MNTYVKAFLIGGIVIPTVLHFLKPSSMPWWPDTVTLGVGFGVVAVVLVWKRRKDRELNSRMWNAIKPFVRRRLN